MSPEAMPEVTPTSLTDISTTPISTSTARSSTTSVPAAHWDGLRSRPER